MSDEGKMYAFGFLLAILIFTGGMRGCAYTHDERMKRLELECPQKKF